MIAKHRTQIVESAAPAKVKAKAKVKAVPRSLFLHPTMSLSGSAQSRSQSRPVSGMSEGKREEQGVRYGNMGSV